MTVTLDIPLSVYRALRQHLLPENSRLEQGGFLFARCSIDAVRGPDFQFIDWMPLQRVDYDSQYQDFLELSDAARARVIKRAHDLGASLVEFHSHRSAYPAAFSPSDLHGFEEFVPHVHWRLKGRPYAAVVVAPSGFDGLAWTGSPNAPVQLDRIDTGGKILQATALTLKWRTRSGHAAI